MVGVVPRAEVSTRRLSLQGPASEPKHLVHKLLVSKVADCPVGKLYSFAELILLSGKWFITSILLLINDICWTSKSIATVGIPLANVW